jgi:hypothetical protein
VFRSDMGQMDAIFEEGTEEVKVFQCVRALGLRRGDQ